jgi:chloride channel, nucleotide-sensitive, 1A
MGSLQVSPHPKPHPPIQQPLTLHPSKLYLYSPTASAGLSIPYPTISLHAIQRLPSTTTTTSSSSSSDPTASQGVYMQLLPPSTGNAHFEDDEEPDSLSLTIIPTAAAPPQGPGSSTADVGEEEEEVENEDKPEQTPAEALFTALSACADLHPDPVEDQEMGEGDDEDGVGGSHLIRQGLAFPIMGGEGADGLPPPMPGSGGWITAENMHEFVDEDGNFLPDADNEEEEQVVAVDQPLGPGAGTVRGREDDGGHAGNGDGGDETKWQKTG